MNISQLKSICEAATPGPWKLDAIDESDTGAVICLDAVGPVHHGAIAEIVWRMDGDVRSPEQEATAQFIATFNPTTIAKILAVVEAAQNLYPATDHWIQGEWDDLQEALDALENDK